MKTKHTYSYHSFFFPFVWDNAGKMDFVTYLKKVEESGWNCNDVRNFSEIDSDSVADYAAVQYFTDAAKKSLFGWNADFVRCYRSKRTDQNARYIIEKGKKSWNLRLLSIHLKIYNTGIGILCFETANDDACTLTDVKAINEYGRRIFPPYTAKEGCSRCADRLGIFIQNAEFCENIATKIPSSSLDCIPNFICQLLPSGVPIQSAIDDRMYISCLVNDAASFSFLKEYQTNEAASQSLYELIFTDLEGTCSCPTQDVRATQLERVLYRRWLEQLSEDGTVCGTLYAVTRHSFFCMTASKDPLLPEHSFRAIYTPMATMVLSQRATILSLDNMVSHLSNGFGQKNARLTRKQIRTLQQLQGKHIGFLNQHMNIEVTCQEQGIELYEMLQKEMNVNREAESICNEIERLSDAANTANDNFLTILATVLASALVFLQPVAETVFQWIPLYYLSAIALAVVIIILVFKKR